MFHGPPVIAFLFLTSSQFSLKELQIIPRLEVVVRLVIGASELATDPWEGKAARDGEDIRNVQKTETSYQFGVIYMLISKHIITVYIILMIYIHDYLRCYVSILNYLFLLFTGSYLF